MYVDIRLTFLTQFLGGLPYQHFRKLQIRPKLTNELGSNGGKFIELLKIIKNASTVNSPL